MVIQDWTSPLKKERAHMKNLIKKGRKKLGLNISFNEAEVFSVIDIIIGLYDQ